MTLLTHLCRLCARLAAFLGKADQTSSSTTNTHTLPRNRKAAAPFTVRLLDADADANPPLKGFHVTVERVNNQGESEALLFAGRSNREGEIRFQVALSTGADGQPLSRLWEVNLTVFDIDGDALTTKTIQLKHDEPVPPIKVKTAPFREKLVAPLDKWRAALSHQSSPAVLDLLEQHRIASLSDFQRAKGLAETQGLSAVDKEELKLMQAHANLLLLSRDVRTNQVLVKAGYRNVLDIAGVRLSEFIAKVKPDIPEAGAKKLYFTSRRRKAVISTILTDKRAKQTNGISTSNGSNQPQPCECNCGSAVSPQAYLVDLLDYAVDNVLFDGTRIDLPHLELLFGQFFAALPVECAFAAKLVRQVRLCAEVLHRRSEIKDDDDINAAVNGAIQAHAVRAYEALLRALGTSCKELRQVRSDLEASARLADRLGITAEHVDDFRLESETTVENQRLNEVNLERLFGLQGVARDPLSTGAKVSDRQNQLTRWQLRGVEWRRNTSLTGGLYVSVSKENQVHKISLFKTLVSTLGPLPLNMRQDAVAEGTSRMATGEVELTARNSSGLAGRVNLNYVSDDDGIFLAVVPEWVIRRRNRLRGLWRETDHPAGNFAGPKIDPDVIDSTDIMSRFIEIPLPVGPGVIPLEVNPAMNLWRLRKNFLLRRRNELNNLNTIGDMLVSVLSADPGDLASWDAIADKLRSASPNEVDDGQVEVTNLNPHLTLATFSFLLELRHREAEGREIKPEERNQALDVLVNLDKRGLFEEWRSEDANIPLAAPFFLLSDQEPFLNPLRASAEERAAWRIELERNSAPPLIDPDIIAQLNFAPNANSTPAFTLWVTRNELLGDVFATVERITSVEKLNGALTNGDNLSRSAASLFHPIGLKSVELDHIADALAQGEVLPIRPEQYGLTMAELRKLFEVRRHGMNNEADASDWDEVHNILVQAEKRRFLYPLWRTEERGKQVFLNPDVFYIPSDALVELVPLTQRSAAFLQWRFDPQRQRAWRAQLKSRIEQDQAIDTELQNAVAAAEEASLPALRDDLVMATVSSDDAGGASLEERKRWVMNRLLINAFESGCRQTTRVAQAIQTMQVFLWGIQNRQIEDVRYSLEEASAETFAEEWRSLGSYATWRSAVFTFLYPENLLLPDFRQEVGNANSDPTKLFRAMLRVISGQSLPSNTQTSEDEDEDAPPPTPEEQEMQLFIDEIYRFIGNKDQLTQAGMKLLFPRLVGLRYRLNFPRTTDERSVVCLVANAGGIPLVPAASDLTVNESNLYSVVVTAEFLDDVYCIAPNNNRRIDDLNRTIALARYRNASAFLEDVLYIPLAFALSQLRRGNFEDALYWFGAIYDFRRVPAEGSQGWVDPRLELYLQLRSVTDNPLYEALDDWLDDTLNPHRIAATRTGADARFVILSIVQCLLDYADSEFSKDTSESLARARELYEAARRLVDSEQLGEKLGDCKDVIGMLISEVGEDELAPTLGTGLDGVPDFGEEDLLTEEQRNRFINAVNDVLAPTVPPTSLPERRQNLIKFVSDRFTPQPPLGLEHRRSAGNRATQKAYEGLLQEPGVFQAVQRVGASSNSGTFMSASVMQAGNQRDHSGLIRAPRFEFCIPRNPLIGMLRLRYEVNWFKLNNCTNLAGQHREVPAYAAPTDTYSGLPFADIGAPASLTTAARFGPTLYRYRVLIERAKQLVGVAQQMEASYLSFMEKRDQEDYNLRRAQQDLGIARANVALQDLRVTEAYHGKTLAAEQWNRANEALAHYEDLIEAGLLESEKTAQLLMGINALLQGAVALITTGGAVVAGLAAGGVFGTATTGIGGFFSALAGGAGAAAAAMSLSQTALSSTTGALSSGSSFYATEASFERRAQEWEFQKDLAEIDINIAEAQQTLADDRYKISKQEKRISEMSAENAGDMVNFLNSKFTNVELYVWMGGIVSSIYRYLLQEATTVAKLAQRQLAFERQEAELAFVLDDYWTYRDTSAILRGTNGSTERRGMTGSARLLQDITRLDQEAFLTDRRKLQLSKTFSLALLDPISFARFRESGVLTFSTTLAQFDRDFPGHYLRLSKRVRVSIIALVSPTDGIHATLTANGISTVVRGGDTFAEVIVRREPESIAFTAPVNATGMFELQEQPEMLLPFEGTGVATSWTFTLPRAANAFDYTSIADVLLTIEYTALESATYRSKVIQRLDRTASGERPFSFRHGLADCWYDLNNPDLMEPERQMRVNFETRRSDFPPNVSGLSINDVSLYFVRRDGFTEEIDVELLFTESGRGGSVGGQATTTNGLVRASEANDGSWSHMLSDSTQQKQPIGKWNLNLLKPDLGSADREKLKGWFKNGDIEDILFVITYGGITPEWR